MASKLAFLPRILRHNLGLKLLSLLVAVVVWHVIRDAISFEVVIPDIRVQVLAGEGMAILNQSVTSVDVTFRGSQEDIRLLDARQIQCVVDLRSRSGTTAQDLAISPDMIKGARGVRALTVDPRRIHITLDREVEKRVPVVGRTQGQALLGQVESVVCDPSTVLLRGPRARLETTEALYTQPVDVDGRVESFVRHVAVTAPADNWVARITPPDVQARVVLTGKGADAELKAVPVKVLIPPGRPLSVTVAPPSVDVILSGRSNELAGVAAEDLQVFVDCTRIEPPATQMVPVRVNGPGRSGVTARVNPGEAQVTVRGP